MAKFEIKRDTFKDSLDPVSVYISCTTSTLEADPSEVGKDVDDFVNFIKEKYRLSKEPKKLTFKEWLKNKLVYNG